MKNKTLWIVLGVIALFIIGGISWYVGTYNKLITMDEGVNEKWAQVENQLQRRNDLIPNLISTVKGFAAQEKEIFTEVTRLRSQWGKSASIGNKIENANAMNGALSRLLLVAENYPQLKSNENFLSLQAQLEGTENRIAVERMRYNRIVKDFNRFQRLFFGRFFAAQAGVTEPAVYFEAVESASKIPEVKF